ncbi:hypothetical protein KKG31_01020 [Patescibacteria group bacterium]|nr:hypothetical protein [Patescibacteria group bacterium]
MNIANAWISQGANPQQMQAEIGNLTQDERFILAQYLGLYNVSQSDQAQMQEIVNNIL